MNNEQQHIVNQQDLSIAQLWEIIASQSKRIEELMFENQDLRFQLEQLKKAIFGSKSKRHKIEEDTLQIQMDLGFNVPATEIKIEEKEISYRRSKTLEKKQEGHARQSIPEHLPRVEEIIEPEEDVTGCKKIGEVVTEVMEIEPPKVFVRRIVRPKYAKKDNEGVVIAELPSLPIYKGNAGSSMIAYCQVSKFVDHIPFHRQLKQLNRQGVDIAESTLNDWNRQGVELVKILYEKQIELLLKSDYIQADETPIEVLDNDKKGATHRGFYWVYTDPVRRSVCFEYRQGRGREGPMDFLKDFKGAIQSDGYSVYDIFDTRQGVTLLACMAHVRRKFTEAKSCDYRRANYFLEAVQKLYHIESIAREQNFDHVQRYELRKREATPIIENLGEWLKEQKLDKSVLPKNPIGKAISYALNMWPRIIKYLENGKWEIDNNLVENRIRPVALGRNNYMFAGSHDAAQRNAIMYSLLGTCILNDVNPFLWLKDILNRIQDQKVSKLEELLPANWKNNRPS